MSAILIDPSGNITSAQYEPGTSLSYNQDGTISGRSILNISRSNALSGLPAIGTSSEFDSRAFVSDREISWHEATAQYVLGYMGVWSSVVQKVEGLASSQQIPIDANPRFSTKLSTSTAQPPTTSNGAGAEYDSNGVFVAFIPGAKDADGNPIGGVQSYYGPAGVTVRITSSSSSSGDVSGLLPNIGMVSDSVTAGSVTLSGDGCVLCTSVSWEEIYMGGESVFRITQEYLYNSVGWNKNIYPT